MKILDRAFCIFPLTLDWVDPQHWSIKRSSHKLKPLGLFNFFRKIPGVSDKILKNTREGGSNWPLGNSRVKLNNMSFLWTIIVLFKHLLCIIVGHHRCYGTDIKQSIEKNLQWSGLIVFTSSLDKRRGSQLRVSERQMDRVHDSESDPRSECDWSSQTVTFEQADKSMPS